LRRATHAVLIILTFGITLSFRNVEDLLAERGKIQMINKNVYESPWIAGADIIVHYLRQQQKS
jgi:transposase-like protein